MPAERFFISTSLNYHQMITLEGQEFHHLAHVMRLEEGDHAELVNGQGTLAQAILKRRNKKQAEFFIESVIQQEGEPRRLILAQALPRINRLDFIIEKATELGITDFWLFPGQQSERKLLTGHQIERLQGLTIAAMKQCGRLYLPSLQMKPPLEQWKTLEIPSFFGDLQETAPTFLSVQKPNESILFFIGPESGFTSKEISLFSSLGVKGVKLHQNILRTDTAALVAASLMSQSLSV